MSKIGKIEVIETTDEVKMVGEGTSVIGTIVLNNVESLDFRLLLEGRKVTRLCEIKFLDNRRGRYSGDRKFWKSKKGVGSSK